MQENTVSAPFLDPKTIKHKVGFKIFSISKFLSYIHMYFILHKHVYTNMQAAHILLFIYSGFEPTQKEPIHGELRHIH